MSLSLLQSYSSAEDEEEPENGDLDLNNSSSDEDQSNGAPLDYDRKPLFEPPKPSSDGGSTLPSALDVFAEVSGPPRFLNNCVEAPAVPTVDDGQRWRHGRRRNRREKQDLPAGAVVESKAQLVGIHDRVRSDIEGTTPTSSAQSTSSSAGQGVKRVAGAANPNAEDAAELLRMCLQCGIPKTYTAAKGMVCPVCGDRPPPPDPSSEETAKKKGSAIKDKEKSKRMKGQSSHATWKSETEMQLRQQFD